MNIAGWRLYQLVLLSDLNLNHIKNNLYFHEVINMVRKFMETYKLNVLANLIADIGVNTIQLRLELMNEENEEILKLRRMGCSGSSRCFRRYALHFVWNDVGSWNAR